MHVTLEHNGGRTMYTLPLSSKITTMHGRLFLLTFTYLWVGVMSQGKSVLHGFRLGSSSFSSCRLRNHCHHLDCYQYSYKLFLHVCDCMHVYQSSTRCYT